MEPFPESGRSLFACIERRDSWLLDLRGLALRPGPTLRIEAGPVALLGAPVIPWRHESILSLGACVRTLPCALRKDRLLPLVAMDAVRRIFVAFEKTDEVSQLSIRRFDQAQSCRNTLIRPLKSAVTIIWPSA